MEDPVASEAMLPPGLLLWSDLPSNRLIELVELADGLGYSEFWLTDVRFVYDCYMGLALAAQHSQRMLLGPGVSDPYSRHPALIGMAMATLDAISGGRAQIGLGTGAGGLAEMKISHERPVRALREAIELLRAMLTGEQVNYDGEMYHLNGIGLGFQPLRKRLPIFIATHSPQVLRLAGAQADGILLANMAHRSAVEHATSILRDSEREQGRERGSVAVHLRLETCISEDEGKALDVLRKRFAVRLVNSYPRWDYLQELGITPSAEMQQAAAAKQRDAVAAALSDDDVRASTLVGTPDHVTQQLLSVLTPEVKKVTIRPLDAGEGLETTITSFINDVWPAVEAVLPPRVAVG